MLVMSLLRALLLLILTAAPALADVRIKDIASFEGIRENQLVGYGLVVGLNGTGDRLRNSPFTEKSIQGMLERLGVGNLSMLKLATPSRAYFNGTGLPPRLRSNLPEATSIESRIPSDSSRRKRDFHSHWLSGSTSCALPPPASGTSSSQMFVQADNRSSSGISSAAAPKPPSSRGS